MLFTVGGISSLKFVTREQMKEGVPEPFWRGETRDCGIWRQPNQGGSHRDSIEEEYMYVSRAALDWWCRVHYCDPLVLTPFPPRHVHRTQNYIFYVDMALVNSSYMGHQGVPSEPRDLGRTGMVYFRQRVEIHTTPCSISVDICHRWDALHTSY